MCACLHTHTQNKTNETKDSKAPAWAMRFTSRSWMLLSTLCSVGFVTFKVREDKTSP